MTDEATVEVKETEAVEEVKEAAVAPVKSKAFKSPDEVNAEHKELQGKKATEKKKIKAYSKADCLAELKRLEKGGHEHSVYYKDVHKRALSL